MPIAERPRDSAYANLVGWLWKVYTNVGSASATCWSLSDLAIRENDLWPMAQIAGITRHILQPGEYTGMTVWTDATSFESRGPLNSYEKYLALSGLGGVDNVVT